MEQGRTWGTLECRKATWTDAGAEDRESQYSDTWLSNSLSDADSLKTASWLGYTVCLEIM